MPCLICQYYKSVEPPEHKQEREAGKCQFHCGDKWTNHTAINYLKHHGGQIDGWCLLHPEAKQKKSGHVCGDISVLDYFLANWGVSKLGPGETLSEWSQHALNTMVHGTWQSRQNEHLNAQNKKLREQLKRVQQISASRLKRLQQKTLEPTKPEPKPEPETPAYPRLVAAG
jgi:hypothetical protein